MDSSNYTGPLTAAELAVWQRRYGPSYTTGYAEARAEATDASAAYWSACHCSGALPAPMAAEAATDEGSYTQLKRKRTLHWSIGVPLYCVLLVAFLSAGWFLYLIPTTETAKVLALIVGAPLALIVGFVLLARLLH